jgi:hypothetical protein
MTQTKLQEWLQVWDNFDKTFVGISTGIKLGGFYGGVLGGAIGIVWDFVEGAQPTDPLIVFRDLKTAPPPPPSLKNPPPFETPTHRIKPPPTKIYRDPPNNQLPPPSSVVRILPPLPPSGTSTNTEDNPRSIVKESLADHTFGCLLSRPLVDASLSLCEPELEDEGAFIERLEGIIETNKTKIQELVNSDNSDSIPKNALAIANFFLPSSNAHTYLLGTDVIDELYTWYWRRVQIINSFPITGLIYKESQFLPCTATPTVTDSTPPLFLENNDAECMIPLSIYDEMEGYDANKKRKKKWFTIPYPKDLSSYTSDSFKGIFPNSFKFGKTVIEIRIKTKDVAQQGIKPIHKCVIMTDHQTLEDINTFVKNDFKTWLEAVTDKAEIKDYVTKFLDKSDIWVGDCSPYRAVLMGWDKEKKYWFNKADWYLAPKT